MANETLEKTIEALVRARAKYTIWQRDVEETLKGSRRTVWFIQGINIATYVLGFGLIIFAAVHAARVVPQEAAQELLTALRTKGGTPAEEAQSAQTTSTDKSTQGSPAESRAPATKSKTEKTETSEKLEKLPEEIRSSDVFKVFKDRLRYDEAKQLLIFKGVMSEEEKNTLLKLTQDDCYKKAVEALFKRSQEKTTPEVKAKGVKAGLELVDAIISADYEVSEELAKLLEKISLPDVLKDRLRYDDAKRLLVFEGVMTEKQRDALLNLSQEPSWRKAVEGLFKSSQKDKGGKTDHVLMDVIISAVAGSSGLLIAFLNFFLVKPGERVQQVYTDIVQMKMAYQTYGVAIESIEKALLLNPLDTSGSNKLLQELKSITDNLVDIIERTAEPREVEEKLVIKLKDKMGEKLEEMVKSLPPAESPQVKPETISEALKYISEKKLLERADKSLPPAEKKPKEGETGESPPS